MTSPKVEDYLKRIYRLQEDDERVAPSAVATAMGVKPPTVTKTLQRMHDDGFVEYERYRGVRLTAQGERQALEILRHHRLLELFLAECLGYDWSEVHDEADLLEHYISETLEARIAALLDSPTVDPHGAPIPTIDLEIQQIGDRRSLEQCDQGDVVDVSEVRDSSPEMLTHLTERGVALGTQLEVIETALSGMVTVEVSEAGERLSLPTDAAARVFVRDSDEQSSSDSAQLSEAE